MSTKNIWANNAVVKEYVTDEVLQKPEKTILDSLNTKLQNMRMLDIGVGGGRTTVHFSKKVKEYVGVDFSPAMIEACQKKFPTTKNSSFAVADARDLSAYPDNHFDLVLFSFNGLDCLTIAEERAQAIKEIKRVLVPNGLFIFSSHNINSVDKIYSIQPSNNPIKILQRVLKFALIPFFNGSKSQLKKKDAAVLRDGVHQFRVKLFYIKPSFQIQQLENLEFTDIQVFSLEEGTQIKGSAITEADDYWIYYTAKKQ